MSSETRMVTRQRPHASGRHQRKQRLSSKDNVATSIPWGQLGWPSGVEGTPLAPGHVGFYTYTVAPDEAGEVDHRGTLEQVRVAAVDNEITDNSAIFDQVGVGDEVYLYGPTGTYGITVDAAGLAVAIYTFDGNSTLLELSGTLEAGQTISVGVVLV